MAADASVFGGDGDFQKRGSIAQAALLFLGAVYIGIGFSSIAETRSTPDGHGLFWTLLLLAAIWSSDAGAYFTGRRFGKSKLWPAISPNKTVEGALGGVALAVIVAVVFAVISGGLLSIGRAAAVGVSAAVVGQFGDLIQSAYKRVYGVKDTGSCCPVMAGFWTAATVGLWCSHSYISCLSSRRGSLKIGF